ncbi:MAG: hypothetical protein OEW33_12425 [Nitrospirota bacterium]|nr:hypothetical protein [Nitrospirota bacterium]MDH4361528.1 hypothetical protein [Nitrospirota bacterium]
MQTGKVTLQKLIQDSQDYGSTEEHMISRVFFDFELDGHTYEGLYADIKQTVGSSVEDAPLEVSKPMNYKGPFNYEAFHQIVEEYYRSLAGQSGTDMHIEGGTNLRMRHKTFVQPHVAEFPVTSTGGLW